VTNQAAGAAPVPPVVGDKVEAAGGQQHLAEPLAVAGAHALQAHAAGAAAVAEEAGEVAAPVAASAVAAASEAVEDEDRSRPIERVLGNKYFSLPPTARFP
jgi:hypothetical protein